MSCCYSHHFYKYSEQFHHSKCSHFIILICYLLTVIHLSVLKSESVEEWKESKAKKGGKRKRGRMEKKKFALSIRCPKSLQMVSAVMKLKDTCSLEEKL